MSYAAIYILAILIFRVQAEGYAIFAYYRFGGRYDHLNYVRTSMTQVECITGARAIFITDNCDVLKDITTCITIDTVGTDPASVFYESEDRTNPWYKDMAFDRFAALLSAVHKVDPVGGFFFLECDSMLLEKPITFMESLDLRTCDTFITRTGIQFGTPGLIYFSSIKSLSAFVEYAQKWSHLTDKQRIDVLGTDAGYTMKRELRGDMAFVGGMVKEKKSVCWFPLLPFRRNKYVFDGASYGQWIQQRAAYNHHIVGRRLQQKRIRVFEDNKSWFVNSNFRTSKLAVIHVSNPKDNNKFFATNECV